MRGLKWMGVLIVLIALVAFPAGVLGKGDAHGPGSEMDVDRILVKFNPDVSPSEIAEIHRQNDGNVKEAIEGIDAQVVEVGKGQGIEKAKKYQLHAGVAYAEIDSVCEAVETPNDSYLRNQWAIEKVQAPAAWDITKGSSGVRIAILDTGIDLDHPDLAAKIVLSANFTGSATTDDMYGHGTHVAGIAAAQTNNALGVAGLGRDSSLMNGKVLGDDGQGYMSWVASGIIWAANNGANVISMSLGTTSSSSAVQDAVNYAWNKGAVVVAAAGNNGTTMPFYPAYYTNCIAVAATDSSDALASWSNRGDWVDVAAPGVSIYSTTRGGNYGYMSGTSMASPNAAGLAGLIFAIATDTNGDGRLNDEVRTRLEGGCDTIGVTGIGSGRINALKSVQGTPSPTTGSLSGKVSDATTGNPISGATVTCAGKSATTDASGSYSIVDIPAGSYTATASKDGYVTSSRSITISAGQNSTADFSISPIPPTAGSLSGKVSDASTGNPISGATITCAGKSAATDASGAYSIVDIPAGSYTATASKDGYVTSSRSITISAGQNSTADFSISPVPPTTGSLSGKVSDASTGNPISGATVSCAGKSATTDASGTYSIVDISAGSYTATASKSGYTTSSQSVTIAGGQTAIADFPLTPVPPSTSKSMWVESITFSMSGSNLWARVKVVGDSGPLSGVSVKLQLSRNGTVIRSYMGTTDSLGKVSFALRQPSAGAYTATVTGLTCSGYTWDTSKGVSLASYTVATKASTKSD